MSQTQQVVEDASGSHRRARSRARDDQGLLAITSSREYELIVGAVKCRERIGDVDVCEPDTDRRWRYVRAIPQDLPFPSRLTDALRPRIIQLR